MTPTLNTEPRSPKKVAPPAFTKEPKEAAFGRNSKAAKQPDNNDSNEFATGSKFDADPSLPADTAPISTDAPAEGEDFEKEAQTKSNLGADSKSDSNPDHDPKVDTVARWKELAMNNEKIMGKMIEFSHLIEKSGKQLETMGQKLFQLGNQVEQYFSKNEKH